VHKVLGKPDKSLRLRGGLSDDLYLAKKTRIDRNGTVERDKIEILYRQGKVVQIEETAPEFATTSRLSTNTSIGQLNRSNANWRALVYVYEINDGWQNYYLTNQKKGLTFEFAICQEKLGADVTPTTIIVHRPGSRPLPDEGGKLLTDSLDLSVIIYE
jgi:hypothetical protein